MKLHTRKAFTLIELMIVIAIIAIIAAIAIPNLLSARKNGNEAAAIGALKAIANAQTLFREGDKDNNNTLDYANNLAALANIAPSGEDLIDDVLAAGAKQGYTFGVTVGTTAATDAQFIWYGNAQATVQGTTGERYFGGNMAGLIFFNAAAAGVVTFNDSDGSVNSGNVLGG